MATTFDKSLRAQLEPVSPESIFGSRFLVRDVLERLLDESRRSTLRLALGSGRAVAIDAVEGAPEPVVELDEDSRASLTRIRGKVELASPLLCVEGSGRGFVLAGAVAPTGEGQVHSFELELPSAVASHPGRIRLLLVVREAERGPPTFGLVPIPPPPGALLVAVPIALLEHGGLGDPSWKIRYHRTLDPLRPHLHGTMDLDDAAAARLRAVAERLRALAEDAGEPRLESLVEALEEAARRLIRWVDDPPGLELALSRCLERMSALIALSVTADAHVDGIAAAPERERVALARIFPEVLREMWSEVELGTSRALDRYESFDWRKSEVFYKDLALGREVPFQLPTMGRRGYRLVARSRLIEGKGLAQLEGWSFEADPAGPDLLLLAFTEPGAALGRVALEVAVSTASDVDASAFVLEAHERFDARNFAYRGRLVQRSDGIIQVSGRRLGPGRQALPASCLLLQGRAP